MSGRGVAVKDWNREFQTLQSAENNIHKWEQLRNLAGMYTHFRAHMNLDDFPPSAYTQKQLMQLIILLRAPFFVVVFSCFSSTYVVLWSDKNFSIKK